MIFRSRRLKFIFGLLLKLTAICFFFRLLFLLSFFHAMTGTLDEMIRALWIGLRFDLRLGVLVTIPIVLAFLIPLLNPLRVGYLQKLSQIYLGIAVGCMVFFYGFDMGNYSYLGHRIDVSTLRLLENPFIALGMAWESYPVVWILLGLIITITGILRWLQIGYGHLNRRPRVMRKRQKILGACFGGLVILFSYWGTFRQYPLLWSDAHFSKDPFIVAVALNPILYLSLIHI